MQIDHKFLSLLCEIAVRAGEEVMDVYGGDVSAWQKADASPLTEADLRADRIIRMGLETAFPNVFILSEESSSGPVTGHDDFFLVDPLDGTKEFLKRNGEFTINIAYVQDGTVVAGVVYAPVMNELFYAGQGLGAWKRGAAGQELQLNTVVPEAGESVRIIGSRSHGGEKLSACLGRLPWDYVLTTVGSSLKFCRIAENAADIYPRFGPTSQWDTAAAQCILEQAGGCVIDFAGSSLRYGLELPVLNPQFVALGKVELFATFRTSFEC